MTQKDTDLRAQLTEIKNANPDLVILSTFPGQYASVYLQADEVGLDKQIIATDGTAGAQILDQAGSVMQCTVFTAVWSAQNPEGNNQHFQQLLKEKTGKDGDLFYAAGHDALWVYATAVKNAGTADKAKVRDALAALDGFKGAFGVYGFDANRNPTISGTTLQIQASKPVLWTDQTQCSK
jgi:branched-chain amino acid transport system substrate-binding protein